MGERVRLTIARTVEVSHPMQGLWIQGALRNPQPRLAARMRVAKGLARVAGLPRSRSIAP